MDSPSLKREPMKEAQMLIFLEFSNLLTWSSSTLQELETARKALASEQQRCFQLEVSLASDATGVPGPPGSLFYFCAFQYALIKKAVGLSANEHQKNERGARKA